MNISGIVNHFLLKVIKPCIIFESSPVYADNTKPVYDEMVRRGFKKKYYLFWYINHSNYAVIDGNNRITIWNKWDTKTIKKRVFNLSLRKKVKAVIMSCDYLVPNPFTKYELALYLTHGTPIKDTSSYYTIPDEVDYCIAASVNTRETLAYSFRFDINRIIPLGFPRNDVFSKTKIDLKLILDTDYKKIIAWYPTFKQHENGMKTGCTFAVPIIHNLDNMYRLNDILKKYNILIVLKPHPSQDLAFIDNKKLSNILIVNEEFFVDKGISSYQLLSSCDGLLTDYSSVYFDFLLTNQPIGLIWEDIDSYKKNPGLVPQYEENAVGTYKIYNIDDLHQFIKNIHDDVDPLKNERMNLRDKMNISTDGNNANRVVDFIEKCFRENNIS